jgi:thymidylate kinase
MGFKNESWGLTMDLHLDKITYSSHTIFSNIIVWKNTVVNSRGIFVLDERIDVINCLLKESINNGLFKQKDVLRFQKLSIDVEFLSENLPSKNCLILIKLLHELFISDFSEYSIKKAARNIQKNYSKGAMYYTSKLLKLKRLIRPPGYSVAFMGTDGSGKSTLIQKITPKLLDTFHNAVYYEHLRPNYICSLAMLIGKETVPSMQSLNPHGSKTSGFLVSLLRLCYYLVDYTVGFYTKIWVRKSFRSCIWIFDRFYYDFIIDPRRLRINLPNWILKIGLFLIPEPDLIICLGTNANTIHQRKPELPLEEVKRQVIELERFCRAHKRAVWIDTGVSIEKSSKEALVAIVEMMSRRFKNLNIK